MDKENLNQSKNIEWINNCIEKDIMIPVYAIKNEKYDVFMETYLTNLDNIQEELSTPYNKKECSVPGVSVYSDENIYECWGNDIGQEPFVINRNYNGLNPGGKNEIEIVEEFRLLFNLYYNSKKREYIDLEKNITVVKLDEDDIVKVRKNYLKTYLTLKNKVMIVWFESRYGKFNDNYKIIDKIPDSNESCTSELLIMGENNSEEGKYSCLSAKKVIKGCKLENCNVWPYNEEKVYIDFIIGVDEDGNEVEYTSNPRKLSNLFFCDLDAPSYFTPVFFRREVLGKYYSKPEVYEINENQLSCTNLWSIYIDNANDEYIGVYLGDLGRNLPNKEEQVYWRSFNTAIDGKLSEEKIKRDFFAIPTEATSIVSRFKNRFCEVNEKFETEFNNKLFLEFKKEDLYTFNNIHIPINDSIAEFDKLIIYLSKIMIDSLNNEFIKNQLKNEKAKKEGSISKLENWFLESGLDDYKEYIKILRDIQNLRSSGSAHRKGSNYDKIVKKLDIIKKGYILSFSEILEKTIEFLDYMYKNIDKLNKIDTNEELK